MVEDMLAVFKPDGAALVPTDLDTMRDLSAAAAVVLEEIVRLLQSDLDVHQVAQDSHLGWNLLPFLDEEETAVEERDSSRLIKSKKVVTTEKAFMAYHIEKRKSTLNGVNAGGVGKSSKPHKGGCHRCGESVYCGHPKASLAFSSFLLGSLFFATMGLRSHPKELKPLNF